MTRRPKRQYLARPSDDKPATRFELMREVEKGCRKRGESVGTPSTYEPTGILAMLGAGRRAAVEEGDERVAEASGRSIRVVVVTLGRSEREGIVGAMGWRDERSRRILLRSDRPEPIRPLIHASLAFIAGPDGVGMVRTTVGVAV